MTYCLIQVGVECFLEGSVVTEYAQYVAARVKSDRPVDVTEHDGHPHRSTYSLHGFRLSSNVLYVLQNAITVSKPLL